MSGEERERTCAGTKVISHPFFSFNLIAQLINAHTLTPPPRWDTLFFPLLIPLLYYHPSPRFLDNWWLVSDFGLPLDVHTHTTDSFCLLQCATYACIQ